MGDMTQQDRLYNLFTQIEAEFHQLRVHNSLLQKRVEELEAMLEAGGKQLQDRPGHGSVSPSHGQAVSQSQSLSAPVPRATAGEESVHSKGKAFEARNAI